jgi:hypothetical protein
MLHAAHESGATKHVVAVPRAVRMWFIARWLNYSTLKITVHGNIGLSNNLMLLGAFAKLRKVPGVQLKSGLYFNISNLFTKIYNTLYYTTNLYL